ncbi:hypothetical protein QPK87_06710 [Kamptonema cortianum]|nr:hypothetical protein [Kamptonema cortianum]
MAAEAVSPPPLTISKIVQVYWPLALSWLFMAMEGQAAMWLVGRMPDPKLSQAGLLIVFSLAIFIESPVIDLLSTTTTLGISKSRFAELTKFTLLLMAWVTAVHALVMFTPLYGLVAEGLLGAKPEVAAAAWPGLAWMTLWSAGVGWRRYLQGIMIRAGATRPITLGTFIRVGALVAVGLPLSEMKIMPSLGVIGLAFLVAIWAEAGYIHIVSRKIVRELPEETETGPPTMGMRALLKFHVPLTLSTMVMLTAPLFVSRALTSSPEPIIAMAAWQVASTLTWLFRTATFAMPEAVISLYKLGRESYSGNFV